MREVETITIRKQHIKCGIKHDKIVR